MIKLNEQIQSKINKQAKEWINLLGEGKTLENVLQEIYLKGMPNKSEKQAWLMTERVREIIAEFKEELKNASEDQEAWIMDKVNNLFSDKRLEERCQLLFKLITALIALQKLNLEESMKELNLDAETINQEGEFSRIREEEINLGLEASLKRMLTQQLCDSDFMFLQLDGMSDIIETMPNQDELISFLRNREESVSSYIAISSMIAYVSAKNGSIHEIPITATMEEITLGVCSAVEIEMTMADVAAGEISENQGKKIISMIITVASVFLIGSISYLVAVTVPVLFAGFITFVISIGLGVYVFSSLWEASTKLREKLTNGISNVHSDLIAVCRNIYHWFTERFHSTKGKKISEVMESYAGIKAKTEREKEVTQANLVVE